MTLRVAGVVGVNSEGDDFDWVRWRGQAATSATGPAYDHTRQTEAGRLYSQT